ncbi:hypothetical protein ACFE04_019888 [Oxalis oulophora]
MFLSEYNRVVAWIKYLVAPCAITIQVRVPKSPLGERGTITVRYHENNEFPHATSFRREYVPTVSYSEEVDILKYTRKKAELVKMTKKITLIDLTDKTDQIELFIQQSLHNEVVLSGSHMFSMKRSFLLTIAGTVVSYQILLLQMKEFARLDTVTRPIRVDDIHRIALELQLSVSSIPLVAISRIIMSATKLLDNTKTGQDISHPTDYLQSLLHEDEERLSKLFNRLDLDGNGKIDIYDLSVALKELGVSHGDAEKFLQRSDSNKSGDITLAEFILYLKEHEKKLRLGFSHIDRNKDGKIDQEELVRAFKELGVEIDLKEAKKLLKRMDKDGNLEISYNEWRDFLLYCPFTDIHDLIKYWRHSTYLDIGEDINVPDDFTQTELSTGMWWRHLVAGGVAGAVSRTCTAPLDRLKVYLQDDWDESGAKIILPIILVHGNKKSSIKTCFSYLLKEGGVWSLWRGNGINVLKIAPESALKFTAYEQAKRLIRGSNSRELTIYERFVAGSFAGSFSQTIIYPLETLKTRLSLRRTGEYGGITDAACKIWKQEGLRSFYRGYIPNILGIIPYAGIDLAVYETIKNSYLRTHGEGETPSLALLLSCGTISSTCGQLSGEKGRVFSNVLFRDSVTV